MRHFKKLLMAFLIATVIPAIGFTEPVEAANNHPRMTNAQHQKNRNDFRRNAERVRKYQERVKRECYRTSNPPGNRRYMRQRYYDSLYYNSPYYYGYGYDRPYYSGYYCGHYYTMHSEDWIRLIGEAAFIAMFQNAFYN